MRLVFIIGLIVQSALLQASTLIDGLYYDLDTSNHTATVTYEVDGTGNYASLSANVKIPENVVYNGVTFTVTKIADKAFANCTVMESISIPGSVVQVGNLQWWKYKTDCSELPFYNCTSLKKVRFEDGVQPIVFGSHNYGGINSGNNYLAYNKGLFSSCPLEEVYVGRNITYLENVDYSFEANPQYYGYSAFYNQPKLAKVTISPSVTDIPSYLFKDCKNLVNLKISGSLVKIPEHAFDGCNISSLILPNSVETISDYAFTNNVGMKSANIGTAVKIIGNNAFSGCTVLADITLGTSLLSIGNEAFMSVGSLATSWNSLIFPESLTSIGIKAFYGSGLTDITIPNKVSTLGESCFAENKNLQTVFVGSGCQILPNNIFSGCSSLKQVQLSAGLLTIGDAVFANCTAMESISIPGTVAQVGNLQWWKYEMDSSELPFYNCTSLKKVRFEDGVQPIVFGSHNYGGINSGNNYLAYNKGLFSSCPLEEVYVGRNITYLENVDYSFEANPQYYGYSAFYNQPKLAKITISPSVTKIAPYLFYKNAAITLTDLPKVKEIGRSAFEECSKLTTLNLGQALETVGDCAFQNCTNVTKLTFPDATTAIGSSAFARCSSVTEITVGQGLKSVGDYSFFDCGSFTALVLPDKFTTMGGSAFEGCRKLTNAKLGQSLTSVPNNAFKNCIALSEMNLPATVKSIGDQAFYNDSTIAVVTMREGLETIGNEVFWNNSGVRSFVIPGTVQTIGTNSFYGCSSLRNLDLGKNLLVIGPSAFENDSILSGVNIPETVYGLGVGAFKSCISLPYVKIPKGDLTTVSKESFKGCKGIEWISLSENITSLGENAFEGCTGIKYVKSYAMTPPEGLVNFPSDVETNGTLFVPEDNDEYPDVLGDYQYSPTWENWGTFKRITENTLLSSLTLNLSDAHLKASETLTLAVTVGPDEATNKKVDWKSDDETVASVSADGVVTAHKVGQTSIHAIANDGGGAKATCTITVNPTMVSSISLSQENLAIRKNHTAQLSAIVAPTDATNASFIWSSTNEDVAKVSEDGVISAIAPGDAVIKATSQDGSQVEASCQVKVLPVLKGDSNDDDEINVVDAVNTVNYIFNKVTGTFAFEAADVNSDDHISISDVTGTTDLIMQQVLQVKEQGAMAKGYGVSAMDDASSSDRSLDCLVLSQQDKSNIDIALDNNSNFVALQADITLPVNVNDVEVKLSGVMATTHQLSYSKLNAHTLRVVVYSLSNSTFMDGQPIFCLSSKKNLDAQSIDVTNAIGSDVEAKGYRLTSRNNEVTSIDGIGVDGTSVKVVADGLMFTGLKGTPIYIYTTSGILVKTFSLVSETSKIALQAGVYLVKMNGQVVKITVK